MNVSKCCARYSKKRQMRKIIKMCLGKQGSTKDLACFLFHWCTGWLGINCEINERNKTRSARLPGKDFWPFSRDWRLRPGCNPLKFTAGDKPVLLVASCLLNGKLNQYKIPSLIWEGFTLFHPSLRVKDLPRLDEFKPIKILWGSPSMDLWLSSLQMILVCRERSTDSDIREI